MTKDEAAALIAELPAPRSYIGRSVPRQLVAELDTYVTSLDYNEKMRPYTYIVFRGGGTGYRFEISRSSRQDVETAWQRYCSVNGFGD